MKTTWLTLVSLLLVPVAGVCPAVAQNWGESQSVAWNNAYDYAPAAPAPAATAAPAAAPAPAPAPYVEQQQPCDCPEGLGDPWTLPQPCFLQQRGITIGGWTQAGIYTNSHGASTNGPLGTNNLTDFNLHQMWFFAEKKTNTDDGGWDLGGRMDYLFGVDGPDFQAFGDQGWDFGWNSSSRYGSAIPQAYLELAFGDWSIKGGHFFTPHGYEVAPATGNFFYSHSYAFYYGEPFTHTGFTVTRKLNDRLSVFGGWVDGWDSSFENRNGADNFLGGINYTLSDQTTFAWSMTGGNWGRGEFSANAGDIYMNSFLVTHKLTDRLTYVFQHDLGLNSNNPNGNSQWYGINQYLLYQFSDKWSGGSRFEWFHDDDGVRVTPGAAGDYYEVTLGLNYKPNANLIVRPELRWDWFDGDVAANHPYNDGQSDSQFSGGFDVILTY
jgi:hypothetical protein